MMKSMTTISLPASLSLGIAALFLARAIPKCMAFSPTPAQRESVVKSYFDGVNKKNRDQIANCFTIEASITDVCALNSGERTVNSDVLADRCMEFLAAHPDCVVDFHYGPKCSHDDNWVVAHWYETGHWSGDSKGIKATGNPMTVEGQTRFLVNDDLKITKFVVTRTFTEWEETLQRNNV
uniref:SnoaL-like domain-containing protein n=1 Tax=Chaetoceros debilis TaxID=122233 RepID=A0A7S3Q1A6_9STRA|eukprot:CAMPEP_0194094904 /NCGR_PEP_ID=MMETSP0149-20130528/55980_1 /TAXON_ID=122233 /ORGANISM="Chaetoceros debilis, Strain MM31A-1" /LENGTH=179 /DNA_ID=CAMNT_0038780775 /DNA_START=80 /DNA_END=619 /DNA_ORIENTATION=-